MPAGTAGPPGALPRGLPLLRPLPEGEIERILLSLADLDARAALEIVDVALRELPVRGERADAEVHVPAGVVREPLVHESADEGDDFGDVLRRERVYIRLQDVELVGVAEIFLHVPLGDDAIVDPLLVRLGDDLVVDIGEILDVRHVVALEPEVPPYHVARDEGEHVPDMRPVLDGHAAEVNSDLAGAHRRELFLPRAERIVDLESHP